MEIKLDLHGIDVKSAEVDLKNFINAHYQLKTYKVEVVTGKGTGAIKDMAIKWFKRNSNLIEKYENSVNGWTPNLGSYIVYLKKK